MKKIALFVSVLLLAGSLFAAAPVFEAKPAISGDATMKFGVNLDSKSSGITNATSSNLTLHLVNKDSDEKGGKEGEVVYGWIKLKDFEMNIDGELKISKPGIEAKLFLGPVYVNILGDGAGTAKTIPGGILMNKDGDAIYNVFGLTISAEEAKVEHKNLNATEQKGIVLGLVDTSVVDVQVGVSSLYGFDTTDASATTKLVNSGYTLGTGETFVVGNATTGGVVSVPVAAKPANTDNVYNFWGAVALKAVENLTFEVKAGFDTQVDSTTNPFGLGVKAGYKIGIAEGISFTPMVGFDINFGTNTPWRLGAALNLGLPGSKLDDWEKLGGKWDINPGASVLFAMDQDSDMDLSFTVFDGDLIPVLNLVAIVEAFDLTGGNAMDMAFGVFASADLGVVAPYAGFRTKRPDNTQGESILQVGTDIKVITNTTFTLDYTSGNLTPSAGGTTGLGKITFATKIAY